MSWSAAGADRHHPADLLRHGDAGTGEAGVDAAVRHRLVGTTVRDRVAARLRREEGFGLIELLIAMLVMALGIMAIVAGFSSGIVALSNASRTGTAGTLADRQMEAYRALPYTRSRSEPRSTRRRPVPTDTASRRTTRRPVLDRRPARTSRLDCDARRRRAAGARRSPGPTAEAIASTRTSPGAARSAPSTATSAAPCPT